MAEYSVKRPLERPPIHPGEVLREDVLPALGLSVSEAARRLGVSRQQLHRVLAGTHPITTEMALRLGKFVGNGPALWLRLQQAHDLWHTERRMISALTRIEPKKEARYWNKEIAEEKPETIARLLEEAEPFVAQRPPRQPVSLRLDPRDLSLARRIARGQGIPFTQLLAMWLHERISREKLDV